MLLGQQEVQFPAKYADRCIGMAFRQTLRYLNSELAASYSPYLEPAHEFSRSSD